MEWYAINVNVYKVQWDKRVSNWDNLGMVNIWNSSKPGLITMKLLNQKKRIYYVFYKVNFAMMSMVGTKIIIGTKRRLSPYLVWKYLVKESVADGSICLQWWPLQSSKNQTVYIFNLFSRELVKNIFVAIKRSIEEQNHTLIQHRSCISSSVSVANTVFPVWGAYHL